MIGDDNELVSCCCSSSRCSKILGVGSILRILLAATLLLRKLVVPLCRGSTTSVRSESPPSASLIPNCAIVRILLVTQLARILPLCFSPNLDRGKSPLLTNATISATIWCSFKMALTMTGTRDARYALRATSTKTTIRPPAWKTALFILLVHEQRNWRIQYLPASWDNTSVALFNGVLNIHGEMAQAIYLERLANSAQHKENLHVD